MKKKFKIEYILELHGKVCLFARQLDKSNFQLSENSSLDGIPLQPYLSQPRKLLDNGKPDLDIFSLYLKSKNMPSPMGMYINPFKEASEALKNQEENTGTIFTWEELRAEFKAMN